MVCTIEVAQQTPDPFRGLRLAELLAERGIPSSYQYSPFAQKNGSPVTIQERWYCMGPIPQFADEILVAFPDAEEIRFADCSDAALSDAANVVAAYLACRSFKDA